MTRGWLVGVLITVGIRVGIAVTAMDVWVGLAVATGALVDVAVAVVVGVFVAGWVAFVVGVGVFVGVLVAVGVAEAMLVAVGTTADGLIVKFVFEMSKKILLAQTTCTRAVVVERFGAVMLAEPLFATLDARVVG